MNQSNYYIELLEIYYLQLNENYLEVERRLLNNLPNIEEDSFYNISTWVWILQKQISLQPNNYELISIDYMPYIDYLSKEWLNLHPRVWDDGKEDVFLSNLSMVYAALSETKNIRSHFSIQKVMTEIRDYVFEHLLSKGTVLNGKNERGIAIDELLSVMPYGLFSPEDLIIVDAVEKMTVQLNNGKGMLPYVGAQSISSAAASMLALYFLEKSDIEKARQFEEIAHKTNDNDKLGDVILRIYHHYVREGAEASNYILHHPLGNENVYIPQLTERVPHYPTLDEHLQLTCQIVTNDIVESVSVIVENESNTWKVEKKLLHVLKNGTDVYEQKLDPFPSHEKYRYYFIAELKSGEKITSENYEVSTLKVYKAKQFNLIKQTKQSLALSFGEGKDSYGLSFTFNDLGLDVSLKQEILPQEIEHTNEEFFLLEYGNYNVEVSLNPAKFTLYKGQERILTTHPLYAPIEWKVDINNKVSEFVIHWYSPENEQFYGFGERYNSIEQRGQIIDCFVYNQYRDQGTRTYIPIPFYLTNSGYGCFINTNLYTKFDIANELNDKCTVNIKQVPYITETKMHFYLGDFNEQIKAFTHNTGKPKMLPAWALGPWMSSNNWDRESIVREEVEKTNNYQIPATVIVLEQWSDETTYYMFNDAKYKLKDPSEGHSYEEMEFPEWGRWPNPKKMVEYLHENNLKLLLWQIPIQKYLNKQKHPLKDLDEAYMIEQGYVVTNEDGSPYRIPENWFTESLIMDFTNEEGKEWWFKKRQYLIDIGVDGFKTDGGEFVFGGNLKFANGQTGSELRNQYPNDYVSAYYDFAQQNNGITFSRAGYTGAQNFPAHWAGDERSTFAAFKRTLIAGINSGLAGITFWGWDLAGFNGEIPTAELFMRSAAMATFCPIMQYHAESKAEFNQDRTPWNIAERTGQNQVIDVYRFFANVRMNLIPYLYNEGLKSSETGLPMMRALMIDYPEDIRVRGMYDQYLFGESLLVAPIIEEGSVTRKVYLPEGIWFNLWTNEKHTGPIMLNVNANLDQISVFVKANQILLLNVDENREIGSSVGNDITKYKVPLCRIYCDGSFEKTVRDHLGNQVIVSVTELTKEIVVKVDSEIEDLEIELVGNRKPVKVI